MALEGELRDYNILELIQLLGQQNKTGVLKMWKSGTEDEVNIFYRNGRITHATSKQRTKGDLLGEKLVKTGLISREGLRAVLQNQKKSSQFLGEILVEEGIIDELAVLNALYTQIHELIYEVFRWETGKFKFEVVSESQFPKVSIQLNAEEVMLNILKMVDEWPEIEKKVPPPTMVLKQTGTLREHGIGLSEDHDAVYRLVDGTRSVQEIVESSLLGKFTTLEILAELLEGRDIRTVGIKRAPVPEPAKPGLEALKQRPIFIAYAVVASLTLFLIVISFFQFNPSFLWSDLKQEWYFSTEYMETVRDERVELGKKIFLLEQRRYPEDLDELVTAGILTEKDVKGRDGRRDGVRP